MKKILKKKKMLFVPLLLALSACQSTPLQTVSELNDTTFNAAITRVCGPTAFIAASRNLTVAAQGYRIGLCREVVNAAANSTHISPTEQPDIPWSVIASVGTENQ